MPKPAVIATAINVRCDAIRGVSPSTKTECRGRIIGTSTCCENSNAEPVLARFHATTGLRTRPTASGTRRDKPAAKRMLLIQLDRQFVDLRRQNEVVLRKASDGVGPQLN